VEQDVQAQFQMALLALAYGARKNGQSALPTTSILPGFSDTELGVYDLLRRFDLLDTYVAGELRQKLVSGDPSVESFFKEFPTAKESLDQMVGNSDIRPGIRHYLKKRVEVYIKKFEMAFGTGGGQSIVPASSARRRELDFIGRIQSTLESGKNNITFLGTGFTVDRITTGHDVLRRLQKPGSPDRHAYGTEDQLPKNQYVLAVLTEKNIPFHKRTFILYAVFATHTGQYAEYGYDSRPLALKEILGYFEALPKPPHGSGQHVLLCLASPTGFLDSTLSPSDTGVLESFSFPDLSLCFYDLNTNMKFFNKGDRVAVALAKLCELETEGEKDVKLQEILYLEMDHRLLVDQSVSLAYCTEFSKGRGFPDMERVKKIFYHYAKEKNLPVRNIPRTGPVMMKER
jgi:hypothetical protein